jgi:hypothetical protein
MAITGSREVPITRSSLHVDERPWFGRIHNIGKNLIYIGHTDGEKSFRILKILRIAPVRFFRRYEYLINSSISCSYIAHRT